MDTILGIYLYGAACLVSGFVLGIMTENGRNK